MLTDNMTIHAIYRCRIPTSSRGLALILGLCLSLFSHSFLVTACDRGRDCCNCKDSTDCDKFSGSCPSGCKQTLPAGYGWGGQWCHIGNLAYGKKANQSSTYRNRNTFIADNAVDGNVDPRVDRGHCSHTETPQGGVNSWWWVDLGQPSYVINVMLYNRYSSAERLNHFFVRIGSSSDITSHTVCEYHEAAVGDSVAVTIDCRKVGQYVSVQLSEHTTGDGIFHLCEAVVMGYSFKECPPGKKPSLDCNEPCNDRYFGSWCSGWCKCADSSEVCDKVTGACPESGCRDWYVATNCSVFLYDPNSVRDHKVKSSTPSTITVQWTGSSNVPQEGSRYMKYLLSYRRVRDSTWVESEIVQHYSGKTDYEGTVSRLSPNTNYDIKIVPRYVNGTKEKKGWDKIINARTQVSIETSTITTATITPTAKTTATRAPITTPGKDINTNPQSVIPPISTTTVAVNSDEYVCSSAVPVILGVLLGVSVAIHVIVAVLYLMHRKQNKPEKTGSNTNPGENGNVKDRPVVYQNTQPVSQTGSDTVASNSDVVLQDKVYMGLQRDPDAYEEVKVYDSLNARK